MISDRPAETRFAAVAATALPAPRPLRVLFLIRQLEIGGAERQLLTLVRGLPRDRCEITVVTMYRSGGLAEDFARVPGVRLVSLDKRGRFDLAAFGVRLWRVIREVRPDVIHGYMYGANEVALAIGRAAGIPVVWGIRVSAMDFRQYNHWTHGVFRAGLACSRWVDLVIANSTAGLHHHEREGLHARRHLVIPNGIDTVRFRRDADAGARWREAMGFAPNELVISMIGRFDPMKDHATFFRVVAALHQRGLQARFVCVGEGSDIHTGRVRAECAAAGVSELVHFVAPVANPVAIYSGSSVVVSTSAFGEGFPNVIGEAMSCEVPCVSTDSGDAAAVIGDSRWVAPCRDAEAIAAALYRLCALPESERATLGRRARERVENSFEVPLLVSRTLAELEAVTTRRIKPHGARHARLP